MQAREDVRFRIPVEADFGVEVRAVHEIGITPDVLSKVQFCTGDACRMDNMVQDGRLHYNSYDGAILSNLLCRLPDPVGCLDVLPRLVKDGGVVVLVTPFSWLEEYTPREKWLGGCYQDRQQQQQLVRSKDVLQQLMEERGFQKIHEEEMPLVIREHQRKYQYIVSQATGWRKLSRSQS
jgi:SAM-dependent methyltransferase